jgi:hypothetical protein
MSHLTLTNQEARHYVRMYDYTETDGTNSNMRQHRTQRTNIPINANAVSIRGAWIFQDLDLTKISQICVKQKTIVSFYLRLPRTTMTTLFGTATKRLVAFQAARYSTRRAAVNVVQRSYSSSTVLSSTMDDLKTGTSAYMNLYPTQSTDGGKKTGLALFAWLLDSHRLVLFARKTLGSV